jgi:arylsulfatase A-like enzyme
MLDDVLVVWMGEFGRTPGDGNGHFCRAWSTVLAGGGLRTGQVVGKTSETGKNPGGEVVDRLVTASDFAGTICRALGIDVRKEFLAPGLRPVPLVDKIAKPIEELLG